MRAPTCTRVIAGRFKGRKIALPTSDGTRPTKSIARESLFDTLMGRVEDRAFVELFAGSGSVGLEALSRGAANAIFCERDHAAIATLEANIAALGVANEAKVLRGDSFALFDEVVRYLKATNERAWFYCDPPFDIRGGFTDIYDQLSALLATLDRTTAIGAVVEHSSAAAQSEQIGNLTIIKRRVFGKTTLSYYEIG
ncbi:16S rRNA (guanine(966)-N(2))-methyltransferase RsmD [Campylobacterota bacterium]|nr:16S rRNA (guanine(966)-N(2))-methyltransferase RsmD [Campylobacterota bacterium]